MPRGLPVTSCSAGVGPTAAGPRAAERSQASGRFDTDAGPDRAMAGRASRHIRSPLVVGPQPRPRADHHQGDAEFSDVPDTVLSAHAHRRMLRPFKIATGPHDVVTFDLGKRMRKQSFRRPPPCCASWFFDERTRAPACCPRSLYPGRLMCRPRPVHGLPRQHRSVVAFHETAPASGRGGGAHVLGRRTLNTTAAAQGFSGRHGAKQHPTSVCCKLALQRAAFPWQAVHQGHGRQGWVMDVPATTSSCFPLATSLIHVEEELFDRPSMVHKR